MLKHRTASILLNASVAIQQPIFLCVLCASVVQPFFELSGYDFFISYLAPIRHATPSPQQSPLPESRE